MTRILRLLLIAAIALPLWQPAAAQDASTKTKLDANAVIELSPRLRTTDGQTIKHNPKLDGQKSMRANAPSTKANGNQIYDYYTVDLYDNGNTSTTVPLYGQALSGTRCEGQMLYPSSGLTFNADVEIVQISFYTSANVPSLGENSVTLRIGETTSTSIANYNAVTSNRNNMTPVYTGPIPTGSRLVTFKFSEPYTYNGNNLLLDITLNSGNTAATINWVGTSNVGTNVSYYAYTIAGGTSSTRANTFLPNILVQYRVPHEGTVTARDITVKNTDFFAGKEYTWTDNEGTHTSNLSEVATTPEQMIAMMRAVYMDPTIPGNKKRGFALDGSDSGETNQVVYYGGVGGIKYTATGNNSISKVSNVSNYAYDDKYGWNIPGNPVAVQNLQVGESNFYTYNAYYTHMNLGQYEPDEEGLTLLLVELKDTYVDDSNDAISNATTYATEYDRLKAYFQNTVKSVRVISEAKRTGTGFDAGTLFKIDCDKMNKFFLLAKGQLHLDHNSEHVSAFSDYNNTFCVPPMYSFLIRTGKMIGNNNYTNNGFMDYNTGELFYHMFEQFSPTVANATSGADDLYQDLVKMQSFPVIHDCLGITMMNHQFMMYGDNTVTADCQDVRDLMFFIPDYRMLYHSSRGSSTQEYLNYHPDMQPSVGLYVIRQDEITPTTEADDYYMLNLHWRTNLDDFLPGEDQEFELYQMVYNEETGIEEYVPVYYMNAQGQYTDRDPSDPNAQVVDEANKVSIVLHLGTGAEKSYANVYVKRLEASQQVTYAIRGRDTGHFLSLQMSNLQSYIIPGTDPAELVSLVELTHYSRYNPQNEKNCYSNRFKMINNVGGVKRADLTLSGSDSQTMFTFYRKTSASDAGVPIATATVTRIGDDGGTFTITMQNQSLQTEYPKAKIEGGYAGYHPNPGENNVWTANFTYTTVNGVQYVNFGDNFILCDNFTVDVSSNEHPNLYIYEVKFNVPQGQYDFTEAHGNAFRVPIYKTDSRINGVFTKEEVDNDINGQVGTIKNIEFEEQVQYSSKTEILRYDAFRYNEQDEERYIFNKVFNLGEDESIVTPNGIASNQGGSYTPTMGETNSPDYYAGDAVSVNVGQTAWAKFVDKYPTNTSDAGAYLYAPVVETFSVGKNSEGNARTDYNYYGGPMQSTAVGKLEVEQRTGVAPMSKYYWTETVDGEEKKFAYYDIQLNVPTKEIPSGYSIYKVRVWRQVLDELGNPAPGLLREEYATQSEDIAARMGVNGKFMFEINYDDDEQMNAFINNAPLGSTEKDVIVTGADGNEQTIEYTIGTFGAQKLRTEGDEEEGVIDELNLNFKVRLYFTRTANLSASKDVADGKDDKFYIVEQEIPVQIKGGGTITGVESLDTTREVVGMKYYNPAGIESHTPFKGVNIVVTRYSDGSSTTTKILK